MILSIILTAWFRLFKKVQMRGAREIDERRRIYRYVGARRSSGTKQVGLFQQAAYRMMLTAPWSLSASMSRTAFR